MEQIYLALAMKLESKEDKTDETYELIRRLKELAREEHYSCSHIRR